MPRAWRPKGSRASKGSRFDGAEPVSAERGISSLIQTQGVADLYRIYLSAQWDGVDYHLAYIPPRFNVPHLGRVRLGAAHARLQRQDPQGDHDARYGGNAYGTLKFFDGFPSKETSEKIYDNLDFLRGVEVFLNFIPATSLEAMRRGMVEMGATTANQVIIFDQLMDSSPL